MFPIRDSIPTRHFPVVNVSLITLNVAAFLFQVSLSDTELMALVEQFGVIPARFAGPGGIWSFAVQVGAFSLFASMFLHGGWLHLIGNIWTLYIFGDNVEDRMGKIQYLAFYLACGLLASLAHILSDPGSLIPTIGASGAISGVMGAYLVMFPRSKISMLLPIFYIPFFFRIPAVVFLAYWFILQLLDGTASLVAGDAVDNVAFWAHIGGFVAGAILGWLLRDRRYTEPETYVTYKRRAQPMWPGRSESPWL